MNCGEYLQERLEDQIQWYDNKSQWNQKWYKRLRMIEISAAATIPFLVGYISDSSSFLKIAVGALGVVIAIITSVIGFYQFQQNWIEYRTTSESLKHEKYLFLTKSAPYNNVEDPFSLLVERVESLISKENTNWSQYIKSSREEKKTSKEGNKT